MSIGFVIPSMRPIQVDRVLHDLNHQTVRPNFVVLVDNSTQYVRKYNDYKYDLQIIRPPKNLGTNPVWNMALRLDADYCGILGDDYRLDNTMIEKLLYGLWLKHGSKNIEAGATVPYIVQQRKRKPPNNTYIDMSHVQGIELSTGKGQSAAVLMRKEIAHKIPKIPKQFNIFFGDNWISYHIFKMKMGWIRVSHCHIYHIPGPNNVSASLNYKGVLKHERRLWVEFLKEENAKGIHIDTRS